MRFTTLTEECNWRLTTALMLAVTLILKLTH